MMDFQKTNFRMTNAEGIPNDEAWRMMRGFQVRNSDFVIHSSFVIRHLSLR